jgi:hypothetical protein
MTRTVKYVVLLPPRIAHYHGLELVYQMHGLSRCVCVSTFPEWNSAATYA